MTSFDPFDSDDELKLQPLDLGSSPSSQSGPSAGLPSGLPVFDFGPTTAPSATAPSPALPQPADPFAGVFDAQLVEEPPTVNPAPLLASIAEPPVLAEPVSEQEIEKRRRWKRLMFTAAPSWMISLVLHVILIVTLALMTLDPVNSVQSILEGGSESDTTTIDEFKIDGPQQLDTPQPAEDQVTENTEVSPKMDLSDVQEPSMPLLQTTLTTMSSDVLSEKLIDRNVLSSANSATSAMLTSRSTANKSQMLERFGGSAESEKSVAMALKWLAAHQMKKGPKPGAWSFNHTLLTREQSTGQGDYAESTNAATAMALLPFLGAGQTHLEGQYKETVKTGLASLIANMQVKTENGMTVGSWHEKRGNMYSHGLASITICEAYAMTRDPDLLQPAQLALNYIVSFQDPRGGGWRYQPQQAGDTSVVGWCLMGLKSGRMGNLSVPNSTFVKANEFLDFVSTDNGAYYGYTDPKPDRNAAQTSIGLLCRMYMGWPKEHPGLKEGVVYLNSVGPRMDDLYYTYYATQVMRHFGGDAWTQWNGRTRDMVIKEQGKEGVDAGSWEPKGHHSRAGGRLYQTALATMILEVYYRHLPLYSDKTVEDDFEI